MSFFEELRRRNVFRVGAAYAVASFVLLQVLDAVGEIIELPAWGGKLILAALVVGLFIVLFVAWVYELTPEGLKREKDVDRTQSITRQTGRKLNVAIILLMGIAIGYLLLDKFYLTPRLDTGAVTQQLTREESAPVEEAAVEEAPAAISRQSVAVLPFDNRSDRQEDEFFVEGIHDDLLTSLARIDSLKVISRTSMGRYRGTDKSIPEIASELGVATVMEGAVQRSGDTVRINVQLIDAQTDEHLWAEIFDRQLTADNLFAIQSEISAAIAKALKTTLSSEDESRLNTRPTDNLAAYNAYLRGRQLMARRNSQDMDQAAVEFKRAVELDPEFALAWVGVAETANLRRGYSDADMVEALKTMETASGRALAIDPSLGEAYLGYAGVAEFYERFDEAEASYLKAIELSPGYATTWHWYGTMLSNFTPRLGEAKEKLEKALELDPLSSIIRINLADLYTQTGEFSKAEEQLARVSQLDPDFVSVFRVRANLAQATGQFDREVTVLNEAIERDPGHLNYYSSLVFAYLNLAWLEPVEDVRQQVADINAQHFVMGIIDMISSMYQGNFDGALETAKWTAERSGNVPFMHRIISYNHALKEDFQAARDALEFVEPRYFDPGRWREAIEFNASDACLAGYLMLRTGDETLGTELLSVTTKYLSEELPTYIQHADRYSIEDCLIAQGEIDGALRAIETRFEHHHYQFWWWLRLSPLYRPLRGEPRFEAALERVEADIKVQREALMAGDAAGI